MNYSVYEKNIEALKKKYPTYYEKIVSPDYVEDLKLELTGNEGSYGLEVLTSTGENARITNCVAPLTEAEDIVDSMEVSDGELRIMLGCGLGYVLKKITEKKLKFLKLVIVEPHISIFKKMLENIDISKEIEMDGIFFLIGKDFNINEIFAHTFFDLALWTKGVQISFYEPEREIDPDLFTTLYSEIKEDISQYKMSSNTILGGGPVLFKNGMNNLTTSIKSSNLFSMANLFEGKPILVAGAGPSLKDDMEIIRKYQDNLVIYCVDTALPVFLKNGIIPDLAGAVDYHEISYTKYRDFLDDTKDVPFLYHNACASMIVKPYKSPVKFFISDKTGLFSKIGNEWEGFADSPEMSAVSHLMIYAAIFSGGNPIILSGFDLGFVGFKTYTEDALMSSTIDLKTIIWGRDYDNMPIGTDSQMVSQRMIIEEYIKQNDVKFYNSGKGVKIEGAEKIVLGEFLETLSPDRIEKKSMILSAFKKSKKPDEKKLISVLDEEIKNLSKLRKKFQHGKNMAEKTAKIPADKISNYSKKVKSVCDFFDDNSKLPATFSNAYGLIAKNELFLRCQEYLMNLESEKLGDNEKVVKEMEFIKKWFESRLKSVKMLFDIYNNLKNRLEKELNLKKRIESESDYKKKSELFVLLGDEYLKFMDFVPAENSYKNAIEYDENNTLALAGLGVVYSRLLNNRKAIEYFKKAENLSNENRFKKLLAQEENISQKRLAQAESYINNGLRLQSANNQTHWGIKICNEILEKDPQNPKALQLKKTGEERLEFLEKRNREFFPVVAKTVNEAMLYIDEQSVDNPEKGIEFLDVLNRQNPGNPQILEMLGLYHFRAGNMKLAKTSFIQAASISKSPSPHVHLALVNKAMGKNEEALSHILEADKLSAQNPDIKKAAGDLYFINGDYMNAVNFYTLALKINQSDIEALQGLYNCFLSLGRNEEAEKIKGIINYFSDLK
ncbi:MAG: hypothetical protein CSA18_02615 [Deltaproteobacteria bacterium]|nr:MAG: hypothetical protein CSB21_00855 [Deltaproteobacteria bacterium]PIE75017.1 MAG: hypothetical protein CSA18_02615 [Deltaproteobacteria bacterium]